MPPTLRGGARRAVHARRHQVDEDDIQQQHDFGGQGLEERGIGAGERVDASENTLNAGNYPGAGRYGSLIYLRGAAGLFHLSCGVDCGNQPRAV